ncbi:hypothetical protein HY994_02380 [Candidatus Micrarchaeota archaeon]|nr:hypothetical protein [Candidatus Micrarchaeota archaeon]
MVDLISHALWAFVVFHHQPDAALFAIFSLLPDAIWAIPSVLALIFSGTALESIRGMGSTNRQQRMARIKNQPHFPAIKLLYNAAHSWLLMGLGVLFVWAALPKFALAFAGGVFLHLALDLFLHKESPFGQYPFFPVSKFKVEGFIHWSDKRVLAINFGALALAYALIFAGRL